MKSFYTIVLVGLQFLSQGRITAAESQVDTSQGQLPSLSSVLGQGYGPSSNVYVEGDQRFVKGVLSFSKGQEVGEGVRVEKTVPDKVFVGARYEYRYVVTNLTGYPLRNVSLYDVVTGDFKMVNAQPELARQTERLLVWEWDEMGVGERREFVVDGISSSVGLVTTDGWVEYTTVLREQISVVEAALEVVTETTRLGVLCDRIGFKTRVKNIGTSELSGIEVVHSLAEGLRSEGPTVFQVDQLAPGEGRDFGGFITAETVGNYLIETVARSAEGAEADHVAPFELAVPELAVECRSTAEVYIGRPVEVCFRVTNVGRVAADDATVRLEVPAFLSMTASSVPGNLVHEDGEPKATVTWLLGRLGPRETREICATFTGDRAAFIGFRVIGESYCSELAEVSSATEIKGVPALSTELSDLKDPVPVGAEAVYVIRLRNQGSAEDRELRLTCRLDEKHDFVKIEGPTSATLEEGELVFAPLEKLGPGESVEWKITLRALQEGEARVTLNLLTERMTRPVIETESTTLY